MKMKKGVIIIQNIVAVNETMKPKFLPLMSFHITQQYIPNLARQVIFQKYKKSKLIWKVFCCLKIKYFNKLIIKFKYPPKFDSNSMAGIKKAIHFRSNAVFLSKRNKK